MGDIDKNAMVSDKFMIKFFNKLNADDFVKNQCLKGFYEAYKSDVSEFGQQSLFDFYMEYLLRNVVYEIDEKRTKILEICQSITNEIFEPSSTGKEIVCTTNKNSIQKIKLNKKKALRVLSDFIKMSSIVVYENGDSDSSKHDDDFRELVTENIIQELKDSGKIIPKVQKDADFNRRNDVLTIWQDTEYKCKKFITNNKLANVLKKVYLIDGSQIKLDTHKVQTLPCVDMTKVHSDDTPKLMVATGSVTPPQMKSVDDEIDSYLPIETIISKRSDNVYDTKIRLVDSAALTLIMEYKKQNINAIYACSGNEMVPGGCADQGVETLESKIYLATSYHLCMEQVEMAYPLTSSEILYIPNILVFKDHTQKNYPMLSPVDGKKISVLMVPGIYCPETNLINSKQHMVDERLDGRNAVYAENSKLLNRYRAIFNTSLFLGYDTIVMDDQGVTEFRLPTHHTALALMEVAKEFDGKFKEILIAVEEPKTYNIFAKYMSK